MCGFDEIDGFNIEYEWEEAIRVIEEYQSETIPRLQAENARLRAERDAARAAAVRWRNRARFWRRVADQTSIWAGPRFYKRVLQLSRRWRREGERHD